MREGGAGERRRLRGGKVQVVGANFMRFCNYALDFLTKKLYCIAVSSCVIYLMD